MSPEPRYPILGLVICLASAWVTVAVVVVILDALKVI
jgi:hypothetical protein